MAPDLFVEILIRAMATAGIVVGIAIAVERLGPLVGGALAGLPIVIAPGFFFLMLKQSTEFTVAAAISSLIALSASQAFLLGYIVVARRTRAAVVVASLCWLIVAFLLTGFHASPWAGVVLFLVTTVSAWSLARLFEAPHTKARVRGGWTILLGRGIAAGLLVAAVTVSADWLGPVWSGFLMTYPIAMTVISITVHQRSGAEVVVATLRSMMLGIGSIAAFTFTLAITLSPFGDFLAFVAALAAGAAITCGLTLRFLRQTN
ncbi:hypothetical protein [Marinovum sp.]|uniref:hypothetical protein n=1 Tax=Marinovum sp. TaxID=2024839 RepID=UPI002B26A807|nr:hypothetical protein [Marinovum sp.]